METIKNVTQLLVAKNQTMTVGLEGSLVDQYTDLLDGEVVITDPKNIVLDATDFTTIPFTAFKFIQRSGTRLIHSDVIEYGSLVSYLVGLQAAETQQLDYVGYNGVSGALDTLASNIYTIRLNILDKTTAGFMQQKIKEGFYKSNASAASYTQQAVARGLVTSLIANYSRETEQDIVFERINGGAQDNALATSTVSVTKGSKYITCSEDMTALILATTILRFGATGAGVAPCYVVVGHDGGATTARVYELDVPWQGATNAAFAAASFESVTEGAWGVKLQGVDREYVTGKFPSNVNFWVTQIDFGDLAAAVVTSTAAYPGVGTSQQLGMLEKELQSDENQYRRHAESYPVDRVDIAQGTLYDVFVIGYNGEIQSGGGLAVQSPKTIQIATAGASNPNNEDANTGLLVTLNALLVTAGWLPGAVAQTVTT